MTRFLWVVEKQFDVSPDTATWLEIISNLQSEYDVRLLTGYYAEKVQPNPHITNVWYYNSSNIPIVNRLTTYFSQDRAFSLAMYSFRPHIVLFNTTNPLLLRGAVKAKKKHGVKLVYDVRTLPVTDRKVNRWIDPRLFEMALRYVTRMFDGVTYITEEMRRYCGSAYNLPSHLSAVWTSGVTPELFRPEHASENERDFTVLYHGTIAKNRGLDCAVRAIALLKDLDVSMNLLGKGDGVQQLKNLASEIGVTDRVFFLNPINYEDVPDRINCVDAGILPFPNWPAWNTSSPIKLFEYLACSKPVIVTDIPAHKNVLNGRDFAFWVREHTPEGFAKAIRLAFDQKSRFAAIGSAARQFVIERYTWEQQANNLQRFLNQVLHPDFQR